MGQLGYFDRKVLAFYERLKNHHFSGTEVLSAFLELVPADGARYFELDLQEEKTRNWFLPANALTRLKEEAWEHHKGQHPVLEYSKVSGDGSARAISQHWSQNTFRNSALYADFYRPLGIEDALCSCIAICPYYVVCLGLGRSKRGFNDRDRDLMNVAREYMRLGWLTTHLDVSRERELAFLRARPQEWLLRLMTLGQVVDTQGVETLTARELQVLSWMADGKSNEEISAILSGDGPRPVEVATVKKHVQNIFEKLPFPNRTAAGCGLRAVVDRILIADVQVPGKRRT